MPRSHTIEAGVTDNSLVTCSFGVDVRRQQTRRPKGKPLNLAEGEKETIRTDRLPRAAVGRRHDSRVAHPPRGAPSAALECSLKKDHWGEERCRRST